MKIGNKEECDFCKCIAFEKSPECFGCGCHSEEEILLQGTNGDVIKAKENAKISSEFFNQLNENVQVMLLRLAAKEMTVGLTEQEVLLVDVLTKGLELKK